MFLAFMKTADMLIEIALEIKPSRTSFLGTEISDPGFLVDKDVSVELRLAPELFVASRALDALRLRGLDIGVLGSLVLLEVGPLVHGQVARVAHISLVYPHVSLKKEWIFELLTALRTFVGKHVSRVLELMLPEKVILVKFFSAVVTRILLHIVNFLHMFLKTIFVGKFSDTLLT